MTGRTTDTGVCRDSELLRIYIQIPLAAADNALYLCQYIEKPFAESSKTWQPLYAAYKEELVGH